MTRYVDDYGHFVHSEDYGDLYFVFINDATDRRLADQIERERQVNRAKMNFLFNISHDIRTPMNSIIGFTALAKSHINEPEVLRGYLEKVDMSNRHMIALIDDILEMSSIESGRVSIKATACDLTSQIADTVGMEKARSDNKHITIETDIDIPDNYVYIDGVRFRRVMSNLLNNAVKFTPENGTVRITATTKSIALSGYTTYVFTVSDNGIGMSEKFLPNMFNAFEREETSTKTGYSGTGLGLLITKRLLELMGGTITVKSKKGEGSTFSVTLPLMPAEKNTSGKSRAEMLENMDKSLNKGKRILVAEDIEINRTLAEAVIEKYGFTVESVTDGGDALDAVKSHPDGYYDLVLMDIQMPVMDGCEAARAIRAIGSEYAKNLPIIALSANAGDEDMVMSIESGMNTHISKPFEIADLIMTIAEYIK